MLENLELVRSVLERTFLMPVSESDAKVVMDRLNESLDAQRSLTTHEAVTGQICPSCGGDGALRNSQAYEIKCGRCMRTGHI